MNTPPSSSPSPPEFEDGTSDARRYARTHQPSDAASMFISAAIFGFFGFMYFSGQQTMLLFQLVLWSVRGGAIGFALAGVLTLLRVPGAVAFYMLVSVATVIMFAITGVWHFLDPTVGNLNGVLLLLFAGWNGHGIWRELQPAMSSHRRWE